MSLETEKTQWVVSQAMLAVIENRINYQAFFVLLYWLRHPHSCLLSQTDISNALHIRSARTCKCFKELIAAGILAPVAENRLRYELTEKFRNI